MERRGLADKGGWTHKQIRIRRPVVKSGELRLLESMNQSDSMEDRLLVLHMTGLGLIPQHHVSSP